MGATEQSASSATSAGCAGSDGGASLLGEVREWLSRFIITVSPEDYDLLTLWAVHTWLVNETYTTPRLLLDSMVPGSGKTTTLEHLHRLCCRPVQMSAISSAALLARMLENGIRTLLIDEADRTLNAENPLTRDVLSILNSGYKKGSTRPVLVPEKGGSWETREMPTFAPVAMAGNNPDLPDDTRSRIVRVLLLPDLNGDAEDSDWELIEDDAKALAAKIASWTDTVRTELATTRPPLPDGITGRFREKWAPLRRIAELAGGRWPDAVDQMAVHDKEQHEMDKEDGMVREKPVVVLLRHLAEIWPGDETFTATSTLVSRLAVEYPAVWGADGPFGKALTAQRFGKMLATGCKINSTRTGDKNSARGYTLGSLAPVWRRMQIPHKLTGATGGIGDTGARNQPELPVAPPVAPDAPVAPVTDSPPAQPAEQPGTCPICQQSSGFALIATTRGPACRRCAPGIRKGTLCVDCGHPRDLTSDGRCSPCHGRTLPRKGVAR